MTQIVTDDRICAPYALQQLVLSEQDVDDFVEALDDVITKAGRPTRVAGLALRAARAR